MAHVTYYLTLPVLGMVTNKIVFFPFYNQLENDNTAISKLEHVQLVLSVKYRRRGDMVIKLTSPQGTTSQLLAKRPLDDSTDGLHKWPFTSVEFWGENPRGEWTVKIKDDKVLKLVNILTYSVKIWLAIVSFMTTHTKYLN